MRNNNPNMVPVEINFMALMQILTEQRIMMDVLTDILVSCRLTTKDEVMSEFDKQYKVLTLSMDKKLEQAKAQVEVFQKEQEAQREQRIDDILSKVEPKGNA